MSGTSEQANGRACGPVLTSGFLIDLAHRAMGIRWHQGIGIGHHRGTGHDQRRPRESVFRSLGRRRLGLDLDAIADGRQRGGVDDGRETGGVDDDRRHVVIGDDDGGVVVGGGAGG